jgi:hypothetical protein
MEYELEFEEYIRLEKRLRHYGLELAGDTIDVKSNSPFIFIATVSNPMHRYCYGPSSDYEVVVYPKAIYLDDSSTSHWNQPEYMKHYVSGSHCELAS